MKFIFAIAAALSIGAATVQAADSGRAACKADAAKLCAGVEKGNGRIKQCLTEHTAQLSDACKQHMAAAQNKSSTPAAN
jgi:hypothetical protein